MGAPDTIYAKTYGEIITLKAQTEGSMILPANSITVKRGVRGEETYMDQIGAGVATKLVGRFQTTQIDAVDYARRRLSKQTLVYNPGVDQYDELKSIADPTSAIAQNGIYAIGRGYDDDILVAARGTAYTGKDGSTSVVLPSGQKVVAGGTGLTVTKLRSAKKILDQNKVPMTDRFIVVAAEGIEDLLSDTNVTSHDYNSVRALVSGQVDTFLGFKFIQMEAPTTTNAASTLGVAGSGTYYAVAYHKTGIGLAMWKDWTSRIDERADLNYAKQLYYSTCFGTSRLEEEKVVEIAFV